VYKLFFWIWTPILKTHPHFVRAIRDWLQAHLDHREYEIQERRNNFYIVKKDEEE
jgi:hypothetical protein